MVQEQARVEEGSWSQALDAPAGFARYTLVAAIITMLGYSLGYSTIGFGLLLLGGLWSLGRHRRIPWTQTPVDRPLAIFGAAVLAAAVASPFRDVAMRVTLMLIISGFVYFGSFACVLRTVPGAPTHLLRAWAVGACVAAAVGLAYGALDRAAANPVLGQGRIEIPRGVGPNGLGTTLMLGAIVSLAIAYRAGSRQRLAWLGGGAVCLAGLFASGSRASLVGWIAGTAYLVWRELRGHSRRMVAFGFIGLCLVIAIGALTPQLANRLPSTLSDVSGNRLRIWHASLEMIAARPLLGTGFGTFERAYGQRRAPGMSPEPFAFNLWLNLAVEIGLVGLAAALGVAIEAVRTWRRRLRSSLATALDPWRPVLVGLWIGLLVDQFADNTLFSISTSAALWLLLALVVVTPSSEETLEAAAQIAPRSGR
jgi:O-antigen ligase